MSALDLSFQAQVETVLGALVKEATVELTKLFESRYQASATEIHCEGPAAAEQLSAAPHCVCNKQRRKVVRSVGVQVDESDSSSPSDQLLIDDQCSTTTRLNGECLNTSTAEEEEEGPPPADKPLGEDNGHTDPEHSLLKEDVEMVEGSKSSNSTSEPPVTNNLRKAVDKRLIISQSARTSVLAKLKPLLIRPEQKSDVTTANQIKFVCPVILKTAVREPKRSKEPVQVEPQQREPERSKEPVQVEPQRREPERSKEPVLVEPQQANITTANQNKFVCPLILKTDVREPERSKEPVLVEPQQANITTANQNKFVCPLILKTDVREPERSKGRVQVEPQQANVSTAEGTAYSPSSSDEAMAPVQVSIWERIPTEQETENHLQLKLKLVSPDRKLTKPCSVHLVNVLASESEKKSIIDASNGSAAKGKCGLPGLKDLRRHQGLHTGHRLCCFTRCANGVWRLQGVVAHSHAGYACNKCGKKFKHRKILRRHERFHSGEKPYSCSHCSKVFALRKSLRRHERFHTGERPHDCPQCGKSFRLRDNLKAHLRFHTGDKPFICGLCSKRFRILRNLQKHNESPCGAFVPSFRKIAGL